MDMVKILKPLYDTDVNITIITKPIHQYKEKDRTRIASAHELISASGIELIEKEEVYQKYAVIDNSIVWFGSIDLLGYGNSQESMLRLFSKELALELYREIAF